jgi:hypothetical protein
MREVEHNAAQDFLESNHIMGKYAAAKHVGLFHGDQLVSMISYRKHRDGIDISRFCNLLDTAVVGGLSKLLAFIQKNENPKFIQSYVDLRYGDGHSLKKIGFTLDGVTLSWKWTDGKKTYNRLRCRANMDDRGLTEKQHAEELKWLRIYDSGQAKFKLNLNQTDLLPKP